MSAAKIKAAAPLERSREPGSRLGEYWLLDELAHLRRQLDDVRANYVLGHNGEADDRLLGALDTIRGLEVEFYGTRIDRASTSSAERLVTGGAS